MSPTYEELVKCAEAHGDAVGSESEVADLQVLFGAAFALLTPDQKAAFFADPEVADLFDLPEYATKTERVGVMLRPDRLDFAEKNDIVTALQECFYLTTDPRGAPVWDPGKKVDPGELVEVLRVQLELHQLCPEEVLLARPDLSADNLFAAWTHGNRKAVARVMCERTRTEIAEFTVRLAEGRGTEEAGMFATLLEGMEVHSNHHDNKSRIDKSYRQYYGNGPTTAMSPNGHGRTNGEAFRDDDDEEEEEDDG